MMRYIVILFSICLFLGLSDEAHALRQGSTPPDFNLPSNSEHLLSLSQFSGKVIYLDFWASWCGPCRRSLPWMQTLQQKYSAQGLQVVTVNLDANSDDARALLLELKINLPVAFDSEGKVAPHYEISSMPTSFIIGRDGRIEHIEEGFQDSSEHEIEGRIKSLLSINISSQAEVV